MQPVASKSRGLLDRFGIALSALCALHCVAGLVFVVGLGLGSSAFLDHDIHKVGLVIAALIAGVAIGAGALRHRQPRPFVIAMMGLSFMGGALAVGHGVEETVLTVIGLGLVTLGHILNLRHAH